ncbi:hypothetical protein CsatB_027394 [Cannabis sativa]
MGLFMRSLSTLFVLLLLMLATEMGPRVAEGKTCEARSQSHRGICVTNHTCDNVCKLERFSSGYCSGIDRRCLCTKHC